MALTHVHYHAAETETTSTTDAFVEHTTTSFTAVAGKKYIIEWFFELRLNTTSAYTQARIHLDNTTILALPSTRTAFTGNTHIGIGGSHRLELTVGTRQIDIDFRNFNNTTTVGLRRCRITVSVED